MDFCIFLYVLKLWTGFSQDLRKGFAFVVKNNEGPSRLPASLVGTVQIGPSLCVHIVCCFKLAVMCV